MHMYNYSYTLTYRDFSEDTHYRKELLHVFELDSYGPILTEKIEQLYLSVASHFEESINYLQNNSFLSSLLTSKASCFMLLFSWEHFYETHRYLGEILSKGENIDLEKQQLLDHLKKK